ncbi:MAG TPA: hypothetical protein VG370_01610 [Chloroflexota bacterium]|nr:hypothetical protein [Chloroflexota bacterium]
MLALLVLVLALVPSVASAQAPDKERRFVYGLNAFNGIDFSTGFAPPTVDAIYVLADRESALDPKMTDVYFWPITNEYRGDFAAVNEVVPGTLEITRDGGVVANEPLVEYVLQFDRANQMAGGRIFFGEEARARHAGFGRARETYVAKLHKHSEATARYLEGVEEIRRRTEAGETIVPEDPPRLPAPFTLYSTELLRGFRIMLGPGEYRIRVRDEAGAVVPDSEKRLVAIAPRRQGIGYKVVPQEKWTVPEQANDPSDSVYTVPDGVVYLKPYVTAEFNALEYARLQNPQDLEATANRWTWVQIAPIEGTTLSVRRGPQEQRLGLEGFTIEQLPGAALGYNMLPFEPDPKAAGTSEERRPDLVAFRVGAPSGRATLSLTMLDADGRPAPGSQRLLIATPATQDWRLGLPVLVPLLVGATVVLWRREQVQSVRSLSPEKRQLVA